jgi:multicomponent Na+:H+ antiporter subunit F
MSAILAACVTFGLAATTIGFIACFVRVIRGPSLADRVLALDLLTVAGAGLMAITGIAFDDVTYLDIALILIITSFVGTAAFAQFIVRRTERDSGPTHRRPPP